MELNSLALLLVAAVGVLAVAVWALGNPKAKKSGDWVSEVWINWEICAGSTMYRQRFRTKWTAYLAVRVRAFILDVLLPQFYWDTDWFGKPVRCRHEYSIHYGVRRLSELERPDFRVVYSTVLPGQKGSTAELSHHRLAILDSLQVEENGVVG